MSRWAKRGLALACLSLPLPAAHATLPKPEAPPVPPEKSAHVRKVDMVYELIGPRLTKLDAAESRHVAEAIVDECEKTGVDPLFAVAIIDAESDFDIEAVSPTGSKGLMQLQPATFRLMSKAKRMLDPVENVRAGIRYVKHLWDAGFGKKGGPESVLLAYNQGPGTALAVWKGEQEYPDEAKRYVPAVMGKYHALLKRHGFKPKDSKRLFVAMQ